ncbi:monovalent cation:proton antiporter-2 (CPA2) family protein [Sphingomonas sp.]|jgi:monovalent cation:proton antiporter-2 (CPA2) family protein|uniref:monovalent cation:proton antiporter-2 (CPA2) family protein n=1 Tax=Sphingomonas sp. TaxID=28214 RepID=UPI002DF5A0F4|nr:monovalent cation:proton antiporter-2 (CPA2) family protein [Sphingomonas sp.]HEV2569529.1 monovalent cation:proton antiporter-2 (CPA2) family protein [Sphingomonas sp.]
MEAHGPATLLRDGFVMLGAALVLVLLFRRLGLGATLGYLISGVLIGPEVLGLVGDAEAKLGIAEIGIALLLFLVGLELSPQRLWRLKNDIFGFGLLQVVLCGAALTAFVYGVTPLSIAAALAIGLPLALSSTAQVLPMLESAGRLRTPFGQRAFSVLLLQDLSIVPLITIVAALSRAPEAANAPPGWVLGLYTVGAVVGLVLAGRYILNPLFRLIGGLGERELFVAAGLFAVLASAALMQALGLSSALGAFIAGVMLADSPYRHELEADVEPFRSLLLGLFFIAVGMLLDLGAIAERPVFVVAVAAGLVAIKAGIIFGIARLFGMAWRQAVAMGLLLSQGGEFGFVLFAQAQKALLIAPEAASLFGAVITLSMATTPFLMQLSRRLREPPVAERTDLAGPSHDGASAIVVGWGRFGQTVGFMLASQGLSVTMVDKKAAQIDVSTEFGIKVYFGDGTRLDLLRQAGAADAQLILFCIDGDELDRERIEIIAHSFPQAQIFVRAFDRRHLIRLAGAPLAGTVREVFESAIAMARQAMAALEIDLDEIERTEAQYRDVDGRRLAAQSVDGDLYAGGELMIIPTAEPRRDAPVPIPAESG